MFFKAIQRDLKSILHQQQHLVTDIVLQTVQMFQVFASWVQEYVMLRALATKQSYLACKR